MSSFTKKLPKFAFDRDGKFNMATKTKSKDEMKGQSDVRFTKDPIVETKIMSGKYKGIWIKARALHIGKHKMDLAVELPKKWMVAEIALGVPAKFIRPVTDENSYTVPVEFTLDGTLLCLSCDSYMTVRDLKQTIYNERKFPWNQIYFMCDGDWLIDSDAIPNDRIFCIIHRGGRLTNHLINLASTLKQQTRSPSFSSETWEVSSPMGRSERQSTNPSSSPSRKYMSLSPSRTSRRCSNPLQSPTEKSSGRSSLSEGMLGSPVTPQCDSYPSHLADGGTMRDTRKAIL